MLSQKKKSTKLFRMVWLSAETIPGFVLLLKNLSCALLDFVCGNDINGRMRTGTTQTMHVLRTRFRVHLFLHPCPLLHTEWRDTFKITNLTRLQTLHITVLMNEDEDTDHAIREYGNAPLLP